MCIFITSILCLVENSFSSLLNRNPPGVDEVSPLVIGDYNVFEVASGNLSSLMPYLLLFCGKKHVIRKNFSHPPLLKKTDRTNCSCSFLSKFIHISEFRGKSVGNNNVLEVKGIVT